YWTNYGTVSPGQIMHVSLPDGRPTLFWQGSDTLSGIAVDEGYLYVAAHDSILRMSRSGGAVTTLASGQAPGVQLLVDRQFGYWTNDGSDGSVMKVPRAGGGTAIALAQRQAQPWGLAIDANQVYWANQGDGTVMAADLADGSHAVRLASGQHGPAAVAVD